MRTPSIKNAARCLCATAMVIGSFMPPAVMATSTQTTTPSAIKVTTINNPVLARNTTARTEVPAVTVSAKEKKSQDKKTLGRCWQRLMTTFREMHNAHRISKATK